jgi:hypothetical protein
MKIGDKSGKLTIISLPNKEKLITSDKVTCQCDCGNIKDILYSNIKRGKSKSCGCNIGNKVTKPIKNSLPIGHKHNKLTIISEPISKIESNGKDILSPIYYYTCKCDCGNIKDIRASWFNKRINIKSCGCTSLGPKNIGGVPRWFLRQIKSQGDVREKEWNIDLKYVSNLWYEQKSKCALTGWDIIIHPKDRKYTTASLDRIDSNKGYIKGNIQWVHKSANYAKHVLTTQEFYNMCHSVVENLKDRFGSSK